VIEGLGEVGSQEHAKFVSELMEYFDHYSKALDPLKNAMSRYTRLYLGERRDERRKNEQWRSNSWLGDPFHQTETEVSVWISILNSQTPNVSAEGVGTEDEWKARGYTRTIDYIERGNNWTYGQEQALRKVSYQGWTVIEPRWREISFNVVKPPTKQDRIDYDDKVNTVMKQGAPAPPDALDQREQYDLWLQQYRVPGLPFGEQKVIKYRGPWWTRNSDYDYYFDPYIEDWSEHEVFIKRVLKPWKWLEDNADKKGYDRQALAACKGSGADDNRLSKWDREIAARQGLTFDDKDPLYKDGGELLEFWRVNSDKPFVVVCNRKGVINKRTDHPYWHRQLPYVPIKNIPWDGRSIGMSSYAQLEKMFADRLRFRDLLLDMMVISVMPVLLKKRGMGLTDMQKMWTPGMVIDTNDPQGIQRAVDSPTGFAELVSITQMILSDQNLMLGTGENVRGQQATVGRVSATEAQSRLTQALVRHTQRTVRLEGEFNPIIPQSLALFAQYWPKEDAGLSLLRKKMVGDDEKDPWGGDEAAPAPPSNPLAAPPGQEFDKYTFMEAMEMDIKFTGASRTRDLQLAAQQMKDFIQTGASIQVAPGVPALTGDEIREGLRRIYKTLGQKGAEQIVNPANDEVIKQLVQMSLQNAAKGMQLQSAQTDQQMQMIMQPPQQPAAPGPEATIVYKDTPPDIKRQLEERAGLQPSQMGELEAQAMLVKAMPKPAPQGPKEGPPRG
jgi:hypothetical protein